MPSKILHIEDKAYVSSGKKELVSSLNHNDNATEPRIGIYGPTNITKPYRNLKPVAAKQRRNCLDTKNIAAIEAAIKKLHI